MGKTAPCTSTIKLHMIRTHSEKTFDSWPGLTILIAAKLCLCFPLESRASCHLRNCDVHTGRAAPGNLKRDGFLLPNLWIAALLEAKMPPTRPVHSVPCIDIKIRRLAASVRTRVWVMAGDRVTVRTENEAQTKDAGFTKRKGGPVPDLTPNLCRAAHPP